MASKINRLKVASPGLRMVWMLAKMIIARETKEIKLTFAVLRILIIARKMQRMNAIPAVQKSGI